VLRTKAFLQRLVILILILGVLPISEANANGELDASFGNSSPSSDGVYSEAASTGDGAQFNDVAKQDSKTILVGKKLYDLVVKRLNSDGSLDSTFATSGVYTLEGTSSSSYSAKSVAVNASDGSVYVLGQDGPYDLIVIKLTSSGTPDVNFSDDGFLEISATSVNSSYAFTPAKIIFYSDYIYVSASRTKFNGSVYQDKYYVTRINTAGVRDTTFESPLIALNNSITGTVFGMDISGGTIYLSGNFWGTPDEEAAIIMLNSDTGGLIGSPTAFTPTSNKLVATRSYWSLAATDIFVEPDGEVVTVGYIWDNTSGPGSGNRAETFIHKFDADFNNESSYAVRIENSYYNFNNHPDIEIQSNGKYLVLSQYLEYDPSVAYNQPVSFIARLNTDLSLDTTFDSDGIYYPGFVLPALQNWRKLLLQSDQRLLIAGGFGDANNPTDSSTNGFLVTRNKTAVAPDSPIIGVATSTGSTTATVSFAAPIFDGGSPITGYTAVSSTGGFMGTLSGAAAGTITVSGLSASTAYSFTVTATNSFGTSITSTASNSITTSAASSGSTGGGGTTANSADEIRRQQEASSAAKQKQDQELREILSLVPTIAGLAQSIAGLGNSLLMPQKCVKGKKSKLIKPGGKCPKGYKVKR
jgi:uncharacterized delta-60 repeat protein